MSKTIIFKDPKGRAKKISDKLKGKKKTIEHINKIVKTRKECGNYIHNQNTKEKIRKTVNNFNVNLGEIGRKKKYGNQKKNHPLWGKHHSKETIEKIKSSCKKSAIKWINKLSSEERKLIFGLPGDLNGMYGKEVPIGSGRCKWYIYKSSIAGKVRLQGTYELIFAKYLDYKKLIWQRNKDRFKYIGLNGNKHTYCPDFKVIENDNVIYYETKGYLDAENKHKIDYVLKNYNISLIVVYKDKIKEYEKSIV